MTIPSRQILKHIGKDWVAVSAKTSNGSPFRELTIHELRMLIAADQVCGTVRGSRLKYVSLTVPPDVAGRSMGETRRKIKTALHTDANTTTQRSLPNLPLHIKRHHTAHCESWPTWRHDTPEVKVGFTEHPERLTPRERMIVKA